MKTFVLIAGLVALQPRVDSADRIVELTALVLNTNDAADVHEHDPRLVAFNNVAALTYNKPAPATGKVQAGLAEMADDEIMIVDPQERIFRFDELYPEGLALSAACSGVNALNDCRRADGKAVIKNRIVFTGAWTVRPIEIDSKHQPRGDEIDLSTLGFVSLKPPLVSSFETSVAAGVLLETDQAVTLDAAGVNIPLATISDCAGWHFGPGPCSFIKLTNLPKSGGEPAPPCGSRNGQVDSHFHLIYALFAPPPPPPPPQKSSPRPLYVPFNRQEDKGACSRFLQPAGGPGDNPPRVKCPTALLPKTTTTSR